MHGSFGYYNSNYFAPQNSMIVVIIEALSKVKKLLVKGNLAVAVIFYRSSIFGFLLLHWKLQLHPEI